MWILSHRGKHLGQSHPENTLEAFRSALAVGVDGLETDVRQTADGVLVLFHDRFGPDGREVPAVTHHELSTMLGYRVPTLTEALREWPAIFWNLDLKGQLDTRALLAVIEAGKLSGRLLLTSFVHPLIEELSAQANHDLGVIVAHHPVRFSSRPDWLPLRPRLQTIVWYFEAVDHALLRDAAHCGLQSFVYGVVTAEEHRTLAAQGPAGIITDFPEYLL